MMFLGRVAVVGAQFEVGCFQLLVHCLLFTQLHLHGGWLLHTLAVNSSTPNNLPTTLEELFMFQYCLRIELAQTVSLSLK